MYTTTSPGTTLSPLCILSHFIFIMRKKNSLDIQQLKVVLPASNRVKILIQAFGHQKTLPSEPFLLLSTAEVLEQHLCGNTVKRQLRGKYLFYKELPHHQPEGRERSSNESPQ